MGDQEFHFGHAEFEIYRVTTLGLSSQLSSVTRYNPVGYEVGLRDTMEVGDTGGSVAQGPDSRILSPDIPRSIPSSYDSLICE